MTVYATRLTNASDTAARVRMAEQLFLPAGAAPLTSRSGIRPDGGGVVAAVPGTMNVTVSPFMAWIQGSAAGITQGGYPFVADAQVTLTLAAGHASLARIDTVAAVVRDNAFDGSGSSDAQVLVVQGTPASTPAAPALPANSVPLRDVNVPAGLSAGSGGLSASNLSTDRRALLDPAPKTVDTSTSDVTISSSNATALVPGLSRTVTVRSGQVLIVTAELDTESGSTIWQPQLLIDGAQVGIGPGLNFQGRLMTVKTWRVPGLSTGDHTVAIRATWATGGTLRVIGSTSSLIVEQRPT